MKLNPYQAPIPSEEGTGNEKVAKIVAGETRKLIIVWCIIFLLNLPFPAVIGSSFTTPYSIWAMVVTLVGLMLAGIVLCIRLPSIARPLIVGSAVTAVSQVVPILHVSAGLFGVEVARSLGMAIDQQDDGLVRFSLPDFFGVILVTLIVALAVGLVAFAFGLVGQKLFMKTKIKKA